MLSAFSMWNSLFSVVGPCLTHPRLANLFAWLPVCFLFQGECGRFRCGCFPWGFQQGNMQGGFRIGSAQTCWNLLVLCVGFAGHGFARHAPTRGNRRSPRKYGKHVPMLNDFSEKHHFKKRPFFAHLDLQLHVQPYSCNLHVHLHHDLHGVRLLP